MSRACCLDLAPQGYDLTNFQRSTQRHVGRRLVRKRLLKDAGKVDLYEDGSTAIHRKYQMDAYTNCAFLNASDVALAADRHGRIDIVKLPRYGETEKPRPLGTVLAQELQTRGKSCEYNNMAAAKSRCKLYSMQRGHAFAVGLPCGEYRVFATERASTWGEQRGLSTPSPLSQTIPPKANPYITKGWNVRRPTRRYKRDLKSLSLAEQLTSFWDAELLGTEIPGWSGEHPDTASFWNTETSCAKSTPQSSDAQWDFRETGSALMSVHVHPFKDCFAVRVMDDRAQQHPGDQRHNIVIDHQMKGTQGREDVTSVCFASDHVVATSVQCQSSTGITSCVKLFDIRMTRNGTAASAVILPSFPRDIVHGTDPIQSMPTSKLSADSRQLSSGIKTTSTGTMVSSLTSSYSGSIVVSLCEGLSNVDGMGDSLWLYKHCVIDPVQERVMATVNQNIREEAGAAHFAIESMHEYVACYDGTDISLHDFELRGSPKAMRQNRNRKRNHEGLSSTLDKSPNTVHGKLHDRYGLTTSISCLAFNESGTSLLGGSSDGDLFVWRVG
jgi:hypothetical protein